MADRIRLLLVALFSLGCIFRPTPATSRAASTGITLVPGTVTLTAAQTEALAGALNGAAGTYLPTTLHYAAVSGLNVQGAWLFVSVTGFDQLNANLSWTLDDATWLGVALLTQSADGSWQSEVQGTPAYETMLASIPASILSSAARNSLSPAHRLLAVTEAYRFPWAVGTSMMYGSLGIHAGGFASLGSYKAVDLLSDGDTGSGHAPNQLLAAASGAIDYVCDDQTSVAIRMGQLLYVHLLANANLATGHSFSQGDTLGQLKTGSFSANCGYAAQSPNWFHVHWAFPDTGTFQAGGWTLQFSDQMWHRGNDTITTTQWMRSESSAWTIDYFTDASLSTRCNSAYVETTYVFGQWFDSAPATGCPARTFGARYTKQVSFPGGSYTFHMQRAGQARIYVDGAILIDLWQAGDSGSDATIALTGLHEVKVEYAGAAASPALGVWWSGPGALPTAPATDLSTWRAEYYGNRTLWGQPALIQKESGDGINHDWGDGGPGYGLPVDNWSARYARNVSLSCGTYRFSVHADDGVRLWVGTQLLINQWQDQVGDFTADLSQTGGTLPVQVEYYEHAWGASLTVNWQLVSSAACGAVLPDLHPYTPTNWIAAVVGSPAPGTHLSGTLIAGQPAYFDWALINDGYANTSSSFDVELWVDSTRVAQATYWNLEPGLIDTQQDWSSVVITPGWHTVKLVLDPGGVIDELDKTNNIWQG
ncbi:MAG TPA: PA14 domain-containing protein, partial [Anaerolineae bacterium]